MSETGPEETGLTRAGRETLAIPATLREQVDERDKQHCRVCGKYLGVERALHHIEYGGNATGMGGRRNHVLTNLITVCWMWGGNCHDLVHSRKSLYQPVLLQLAAGQYGGGTALQILRWSAPSRRGNTPLS